MIFATSKYQVTRCKDTCPLFNVCAIPVIDRNNTRECPGREINQLWQKGIRNCPSSENKFLPVKLTEEASVEVQIETVIEKFCSCYCQRGDPDAHSCECGWDRKTECEFNDYDERPTEKCPIYHLPAGKYELKNVKKNIVRTGDCEEPYEY